MLINKKAFGILILSTLLFAASCGKNTATVNSIENGTEIADNTENDANVEPSDNENGETAPVSTSDTVEIKIEEGIVPAETKPNEQNYVLQTEWEKALETLIAENYPIMFFDNIIKYAAANLENRDELFPKGMVHNMAPYSVSAYNLDSAAPIIVVTLAVESSDVGCSYFFKYINGVYQEVHFIPVFWYCFYEDNDGNIIYEEGSELINGYRKYAYLTIQGDNLVFEPFEQYTDKSGEIISLNESLPDSGELVDYFSKSDDFTQIEEMDISDTIETIKASCEEANKAFVDWRYAYTEFLDTDGIRYNFNFVLFDFDKDGTPELLLVNKNIGHIYKFENGKVANMNMEDSNFKVLKEKNEIYVEAGNEKTLLTMYENDSWEAYKAIYAFE